MGSLQPLRSSHRLPRTSARSTGCCFLPRQCRAGEELLGNEIGPVQTLDQPWREDRRLRVGIEASCEHTRPDRGNSCRRSARGYSETPNPSTYNPKVCFRGEERMRQCPIALSTPRKLPCVPGAVPQCALPWFGSRKAWLGCLACRAALIGIRGARRQEEDF